MTRALPALLLIVLWGAPAPARVPPDDEADLFGEDDDTPTPPKFSEKRFEAEDDKLQIGGSLYLRSIASFTDGTDVEDHTLSFPNIVELYLDGRPSDRLRGFVKGRLSWNPSVSEQSISNPVFEAFGFSTRDLTLQLDQLWLKFDISRRVYVTIGQQAVRWGATRIWNPVDVINTTFRTPLALFDTRTGVPLLKLHIPVETWNFYVLGMMSEVDTFDDAGVAARAEAVFSTVEVGVLGAYRKGSDPTVGVDVSAGVWDLDITSELGIRFEEANDDKAALQWSVGVEYGIKYSDEDVMYLAAEYFYNQRGRDTQDAWSDAATALAGVIATPKPPSCPPRSTPASTTRPSSWPCPSPEPGTTPRSPSARSAT